MPPVGYRLWPLLAHSVLIQATTFLLRPAGSYQALAIQAPASLLGLIGAGFALVPVLLALPVGRLVNRLGERRLMLAGSLVTVAASLVFLFGAGSITGLLLANAILGPATSVA